MTVTVNKTTPIITYYGVLNNHGANIAASGAIASKESLSFITAYNYSGAKGIQSSTIQNIGEVGDPTPENIDTYFSISGQGMLIVKDSSGNSFYTRNGSFDVDGEGNLTNVLGYRLQAYPVKPDGTLLIPNIDSIQNLQSINVNNLIANPTATSNISNVLQLPSTAPVGPDSLYNQTVNIYDSLGEIHSLNFAWQKSANQTWDLTVTDPNGVGTVPANQMRVVFDQNGAPLTFNGATVMQPLVIRWSNGAADSNINLNLGEVGSMLGVISAGTQVINRPLKIDGNTTGEYESLSIDEDGFVSVIFSNGQIVKKYKTPIANFRNINGLKEVGASIYRATSDSGLSIYNWPGENGVGNLNPSTLESSTVEPTKEYLKILKVQMIANLNTKPLHVEKEFFEEISRI